MSGFEIPLRTRAHFSELSGNNKTCSPLPHLLAMRLGGEKLHSILQRRHSESECGGPQVSYISPHWGLAPDPSPGSPPNEPCLSPTPPALLTHCHLLQEALRPGLHQTPSSTAHVSPRFYTPQESVYLSTSTSAPDHPDSPPAAPTVPSPGRDYRRGCGESVLAPRR